VCVYLDFRLSRSTTLRVEVQLSMCSFVGQRGSAASVPKKHVLILCTALCAYSGALLMLNRRLWSGPFTLSRSRVAFRDSNKSSPEQQSASHVHKIR